MVGELRRLVKIEITKPPPEEGELGAPITIEGSAKFDAVGAPPWVYGQVRKKEWYKPEVIEETYYLRGFPMPISGDFKINWTPEKAGIYEVTLLATPAPIPLPVIGVPPIVGESDMVKVTVKEEVAVWEQVQEVTDIIVGAGPEVTAWEQVQEVSGIVVGAAPEITVWEQVQEVPGIVVGAGPPLTAWMLVEEVHDIIVGAGPAVSVWELVKEVPGIVVGAAPPVVRWELVEEVSGIVVAPALRYSLEVSIEPPGTGRVTVSPSKATYPLGTRVTLTAYPNSGYEFDRWGGWEDYGTANPVTITMDSDKWLVAVFREVVVPLYTLEVSMSPDVGWVPSKEPDKPYYDRNEVVKITAYPPLGYEFDYWLVNGSKRAYNPASVIMTKDTVAVAYYKKVAFTLEVSMSPDVGWVPSKEPDKPYYDRNEVVKITAYPPLGYEFDYWLVNGSKRAYNPASVIMTKDTVAVAYYKSV